MAFRAHPKVPLAILAKAPHEVARQAFFRGHMQHRAIGLIPEQTAAVSADPKPAGVILQHAIKVSFGPGINPVIGHPTALIEPTQSPTGSHPTPAFAAAGQAAGAKVLLQILLLPGGCESTVLPD